MSSSLDIDSAPNIIIAGKPWPVPLLAAKQNKIIDPLILGLLPIFAQWQTDKEAALSKLGAREYDALLEIAFVALKRAHPELSREEFLDLPVTLPELISAFSIIAQQTGVFARDGGEKSTGEVVGE